MNPNIKNLIPSSTLRMNELSQRLENSGKTIYKLGFGQSPFPVPDVMVAALRQYAAEKSYLPVTGLPELREVVAKYYQRTQNLNCSAENVLIAPGSKMLLYATQLAYDTDLLLPAPSWVSYAPQSQIIGRKTHWLPTTEAEGWRLTAETLDEHCQKNINRKILILNYPNNPIGNTYDIEQLKALAEVARKHNVIIFSDEIYGELNHNGEHVSIAQFYPEGTIITGGLSKWAGAGGWRFGTAVFPKELADLQKVVQTIASETYSSTASPIQYAAVEAYKENPDLEIYRINSRRILKTIGNYVHQRLHKMNISTPKPEGGFYFFINFEHYRNLLLPKGIKTSTVLSEAVLNEANITMLSGVDFGRKPEELVFRIAYVDFDGKQTLKVVDEHYQSKRLDIDFLENDAPKIIGAMDSLERWLSSI
ncbi:MAG: pyridoxal phosphate-dependent aminotransferase [Saprospiraceae bacterium]